MTIFKKKIASIILGLITILTLSSWPKIGLPSLPIPGIGGGIPGLPMPGIPGIPGGGGGGIPGLPIPSGGGGIPGLPIPGLPIPGIPGLPSIPGIAGDALASAFGPVIDRFGDRTDEAIDRTNAAIEERLKQVATTLDIQWTKLDTLVNTVDKKVTQQLTNVNNVLDVQQNKVQQKVLEAIDNVDKRIQENINTVDEITELRIGQFNTGLTFTSYYLTLSIWQIVVGFAQLILVLLLVYFVLSTVSRFRPDGLNPKEISRILNRSKVFGLITLVGLILISIYNPIKSRSLNRSYGKVIDSYEQDLDFASKIYDYRKAAYDSYILSELDRRNSLYEYYKIKYELLKDLMYRPKLALFNKDNVDNIVTKINQMAIAYKESKPDDPEYYIIIAMYYSNAVQNRNADIISYYLCNKALSNRTQKDIIGSKPLDVFALNIIRNQNVHPFTDKEIDDVVKELGIDKEVDDADEVKRVAIHDSLFNKFSPFAETFQYNRIMGQTATEDEKDFIGFLRSEVSSDEDAMKSIGNRMIDRWIRVVFDVKRLKSSQVKLSSTDLNDSYVQYVVNLFAQKGWLSKDYTSLNEESNNLLKLTFEGNDNEKQKAVQMCTDSLSMFKKYIVSDKLLLFSIRPKIALAGLEINKTRRLYNLTNAFAISYKSYIKDKNKTALVVALELSALQGIYSRDIDKPRPLCLTLLEDYKSLLAESEKKIIPAAELRINRMLQSSRLNFL